jgi:hypothetical protein
MLIILLRNINLCKIIDIKNRKPLKPLRKRFRVENFSEITLFMLRNMRIKK